MAAYDVPSPAFGYYEVVRVRAGCSELLELDRRSGVILGRAQCDDGRWFYAVQILDGAEIGSEGWAVEERMLEATGRHLPRDDIYPGGSIRVSPDGDLID